MNEELPEVMQVILEYMSDSLVKEGVDAKKACELAYSCCIAVMKAVGGDNIYIPKGVRLTYSRRDAEIYREFGHMSIKELQAKYNLTSRRIYQILASVNCGIELPEQLLLFNEGDENYNE